ncbi:ribosome-associated translation inhibitor RaiA [Dermabacter vaginalis]|uniref:Ribosome hibernation promoting factor n=1 Tax=Dermabacter vaginalis TaxID=1630135 RepID=A0A1B0ZJI2_9MICO|nr:ribosome-associated translation inhibitor RaiA [Dermabacter vaginalis]ANP28057.1 ribosomal subunit interface protein [Dermabacter vaginalis]MCG7443000.1 ribosome-associated translation inhibitor RaiA [Dermabacter vaginalis]MCT2149499.1 ribosome-associated translation inhibitor RaiA [Dermabacter vaginalis]
MDINVVGRQMDVSERFQRHLEGKLEKVSQLAPSAMRIDVEVSSEKNPRRAEESERVELTVHDEGQVIRSEARSGDLYSALDLALAKLLERLRRLADRRKDRHRGRSRGHGADAETLRKMQADTERIEELFVQAENEGRKDLKNEGEEPVEESAPTSPIVIREKKHKAQPMSIDDALYQMELVGHDFYLFIDEETSNPKVVYRRKGWNYGVIELE